MRYKLKNSDEVFHYWANQVQSEGECGNVSFNGPRVFSYNRCIAMLHKKGDETLALFGTVGRNSSSTAKHQSYARSAASQFRQIVVPDCNPRSAGEHARNLQAILEEHNDRLKLAKRAKMNGPLWREMALGAAGDFNAYAVFFDHPERFSEEATAQIAVEVEREKVERLKAEKEEAKKRDAKLVEDLAAWRNGEDKGLYGLSFTALRLGYFEGGRHGGDGWIVETSKGANIPVDDAKRLWPLILRVRKGTKDYEPGMPLGVYRLTKIKSDGSIVVGCHDIGFAEVEAIAGKLGLALPELEAL